MSAFLFYIDRLTLDSPHMLVTAALIPRAPSASIVGTTAATSLKTAALPASARTPRVVSSICNLPADLILPNRVGLRNYIANFLNVGDLLPMLENYSTMCVAWYQFGSYNIDFHKQRYHNAHCHLNCSERSFQF